MERDQDTAVVRVLARPQFEGHELAWIEWDGREWVTASQASTAVGYSNPLQIANNLRKHWQRELIEGADYRVVDGEALRHLKAAGLVEPNAASVLLLSRSGVDIVVTLAKTDAGRALRRWLADEVYPSIRSTGAYAHPALPAAGPTPLPVPTEVLPELRDCPAELVLELTHAEAQLGQPLLNLRAAVLMRGPFLRRRGFTDDFGGTGSAWDMAREIIEGAHERRAIAPAARERWVPTTPTSTRRR